MILAAAQMLRISSSDLVTSAAALGGATDNSHVDGTEFIDFVQAFDLDIAEEPLIAASQADEAVIEDSVREEPRAEERLIDLAQADLASSEGALAVRTLIEEVLQKGTSDMGLGLTFAEVLDQRDDSGKRLATPRVAPQAPVMPPDAPEHGVALAIASDAAGDTITGLPQTSADVSDSRVVDIGVGNRHGVQLSAAGHEGATDPEFAVNRPGMGAETDTMSQLGCSAGGFFDSTVEPLDPHHAAPFVPAVSGPPNLDDPALARKGPLGPNSLAFAENGRATVLGSDVAHSPQSTLAPQQTDGPLGDVPIRLPDGTPSPDDLPDVPLRALYRQGGDTAVVPPRADVRPPGALGSVATETGAIGGTPQNDMVPSDMLLSDRWPPFMARSQSTEGAAVAPSSAEVIDAPPARPARSDDGMHVAPPEVARLTAPQIAASLPDMAPITVPMVSVGSAGQADSAQGVAVFAPVTPQQARDEIVAQVRRGTEGVIEVDLAPAELGRLRITVQRDEGIVRVTVEAERQETLDLMRRHADQLGQDLRQTADVTPRLRFEQAAGGAFDGGAGQRRTHDDRAQTSTADTETLPEPAQRIVIGAAGMDIRV